MNNSDMLLFDIMLRLSALEKMLLDNGVVTKEQYTEELNKLSEKVSKIVIDKAEGSSNLQEFVDKLK
jgi:hypothetical protein